MSQKTLVDEVLEVVRMSLEPPDFGSMTAGSVAHQEAIGRWRIDLHARWCDAYRKVLSIEPELVRLLELVGAENHFSHPTVGRVLQVEARDDGWKVGAR